MIRATNQTGRGSRRRGISLIEAAVSMVIIAVMMTAALQTAGATRTSLQNIGDRGVADLLAADLMNEILTQFYEDPDYGPGSFGLSAAEAVFGDRRAYEDVDDYDGWSMSPPEYKDGTPMTGYNNWARSVEVDWVRPNVLDEVRPSDTGVKKIVVHVSKNGKPLSSLSAIRTRAMDNMYATRKEKLGVMTD